MPIVSAVITPHPPVLIPEIGKEHLDKLSATLESMKKIEQEVYASKPDSIVIISPHGEVLEDSFSINLNSDYIANFKDFGDFSLELKLKSDYMTIQEIRAGDESSSDVPIVLTSNQELDHGFGVPLYYLTQHLKDVPVIPITYSAQSLQEQYEFGKFLHRQLSKIDKRFTIIASGDLSHKLTKEAPGGFSEKAADFDKQVVELVKKNDVEAFLKIDPKLSAEAGECGLRSIAIMLGVIEQINVTPEVLSYEGPFGVGYMVANYKFE